MKHEAFPSASRIDIEERPSQPCVCIAESILLSISMRTHLQNGAAALPLPSVTVYKGAER
jgi:hypothetical protein